VTICAANVCTSDVNDRGTNFSCSTANLGRVNAHKCLTEGRACCDAGRIKIEAEDVQRRLGVFQGTAATSRTDAAETQTGCFRLSQPVSATLFTSVLLRRNATVGMCLVGIHAVFTFTARPHTVLISHLCSLLATHHKRFSCIFSARL